MAGTYDTNVVIDDGTAIHITVMSSANDVMLFLQEFRSNTLIVGLATTRTRSRSSSSASAATACFLVHASIRFVGVGNNGDAQKLFEDYDLQVANTVDPSHVAAEALWWPLLQQAGLKAVARAVMGVQIDKPRRVTMSQWDTQVLTEQVRYTTINPFVSYEIGRQLLHDEY
ncbi:uncharacterized protein LOC133905486 [Phragmites australis]|uniref:uncharacterized protein LOC133905486 n=1 Tax=Phragmites australis TaxID=29695 RepID=UPI002D76FDDA|nr:uncharacterized protein LOC133905486 [Phragmites australis]